MSKSRQQLPQESDLLIRVWPTRHHNCAQLKFHYEDWHQLVYAAEGIVSVLTQDGTWIVPPHRAVWVPAGVVHQVDLRDGTSLRSLFFHRSAGIDRKTGTMGLTPLARELILHIASLAPLHRKDPAHRRLTAVLLDQLRELPSLPVYLPQPRGETGRRAAEGLAEWERSVEEVAEASGVSLRTLERIFLKETGLTLGMWRQQARLLESLRLLSEGESVGNVAFQVGYASSSAFGFAFRRAFGVSPASYYSQSLLTI